MQNWKKKLCIVISILVITSSMAGCGSSAASATETAVSTESAVTSEATEDEETAETEASAESVVEASAEAGEAAENIFTYSDAAEEAPADTTITAKVSAIDGNQVTLEIGGSGGMGGEPSGQDGQTPPDKPEASGDGQDGQKEEPADKAENAEAGQAENAAGDDTSEPATEADQAADSEGQDANAESNAASQPDRNGSQEAADAAPEKPDDSQNSGEGQTPDAQSGESETKEAALIIGDEAVITASGEAATLDDITEGCMLEITFDADGLITEIAVTDEASMSGGMGGPGGGSSAADISYTAANEYTEDTTVTDETITSEGTDENAVLNSGASEVVLDNDTIERTSDDSTGGDNSSFYGVGAAVLGTDGNTYVKDSTITTDAAGGAGLFAYGDGTVYAANTTINTNQDTSGGIHAAGGGKLYAWQLTVSTNGESAAAIRSDRGGGTMVVDGGTYTSNGVGSPAVYCTADIAVNDAELTANGSEAICMEGLNTIHLFDCNITGSMQDLDQNDTTWNIIVYQSMSGDSEVGSSNMQIIGGTLTAENGGMFYTTNTECNILLSDVDITYADDSEFFLQCTGNNNQRGWGTSGANGSDCTFTGDSQEMEGKVIWDSISNLDFYMTNGSKLTGSFVDDETYAGAGGDGVCNVYISEDSQWIVTGDSTVTNLYNAGTIQDEDGNPVSVVGTDGTVYVSGTSEYTITVSSYSDSADLSGAAEADTWANHEVEMPSELQ